MTAQMTSQKILRATPETVRWLALGAVVGPILFTLAWIVLGFLSPGYTAWGTRIAPYSPISQPISGLGLGPTGPYMNAVFVLSGLMVLVGVIGVFQTTRATSRPAARWVCAGLLALAPVGSIVDGIFTMESFLPHFVGFALACSVVLGFLVAGFFFRGIPGWRRLGNGLLFASPLTLLLVVLFLATFSPTVAGTQKGVAGLTERLLVIEIYAWYVAMGWLAFRYS